MCVCVSSKSWSIRCRLKRQLIFLHSPTSVPLSEHFCLFDFTASDGACIIISKTRWWLFFCWNLPSSLLFSRETWKCFCGYSGANWLNHIMALRISFKCYTICKLRSWGEIYGHTTCSREIFLSQLPVFRSYVFPAWERPVSSKHLGHLSEL